eukprot:8231355-Ditylum_brightwellii.AAC.1
MHDLCANFFTSTCETNIIVICNEIIGYTLCQQVQTPHPYYVQIISSAPSFLSSAPPPKTNVHIKKWSTPAYGLTIGSSQ